MVKAIGGSIVALILLAVLAFCTVQLNPTMLMSDFDRHQFNDCPPASGDPPRGGCNMIPDYFRVGETRAEVASRMAREGYTHYPSNDTTGRFTDEFDKRGGSMSFACSFDFNVLARFDETGKLEEIGGYRTSRCL